MQIVHSGCFNHDNCIFTKLRMSLNIVMTCHPCQYMEHDVCGKLRSRFRPDFFMIVHVHCTWSVHKLDHNSY